MVTPCADRQCRLHFRRLRQGRKGQLQNKLLFLDLLCCVVILKVTFSVGMIALAAHPQAACQASHQASHQQQEEGARDKAGTFRFTRRSRTPLFWRWAALDTPVYERSTLRGLLCLLHAFHCFARISMSSSARFALLCTGDNLVSRLAFGAPLSRPRQLLSALAMARRKRRCLSRRAEPQASALLDVRHSTPRRPL